MSLPARILEHLAAGPDYAAGIAAALDAKPAAVTQAISTLRGRGLVGTARTESAAGGGHPRVYVGLVALGHVLVEDRGSTYLDDLRDETFVLRAEYPDAEIEALLYGNGGSLTRGRRVA